MPVTAPPSVEAVRARFPSLRSGFAYMDNAGGTQVPDVVPDAIRDYMFSSYAQTDACYPASLRASETVDRCHAMLNTFFGGDGLGHPILGPSSSALLRMLANCYAEALDAEDEIIVAESGHEANISPWLALARQGYNVRMWEAEPDTGSCLVEGLARLLSDRTRLVVLPIASNILGAVEDFGGAIKLAKEAGARVVLDAVAYAPHLPLDVAAWGADWVVFSTYKVFGPHMAALWGSRSAMSELTGPNHSIVPRGQHPYKFELGGSCHELCAGQLALADYYCFLSGRDEFDRRTVVEAMTMVDAMERPLTQRLLEFLSTKADVSIVGASAWHAGRLPIVSLNHRTLAPSEIARAVLTAECGIKTGSFYSYRLCERMGIDPVSGVARISLAHTNSPEEVERLIAALDPVL